MFTLIQYYPAATEKAVYCIGTCKTIILLLAYLSKQLTRREYLVVDFENPFQFSGTELVAYMRKRNFEIS
jgi:hypothetical protein